MAGRLYLPWASQHRATSPDRNLQLSFLSFVPFSKTLREIIITLENIAETAGKDWTFFVLSEFELSWTKLTSVITWQKQGTKQIMKCGFYSEQVDLLLSARCSFWILLYICTKFQQTLLFCAWVSNCTRRSAWRAGDGICRQLLVFFAGKHHSKIITRLRHFIQNTFLLSKDENNADWHQRAEFKVPTKLGLTNHTVRFQVSEPEALQHWNHWAWDNSCCKQPFLQVCEALPLPTLCSAQEAAVPQMPLHPQGFYSQTFTVGRDFTKLRESLALLWKRERKSAAESLADWASLAAPRSDGWLQKARRGGKGQDLGRLWGWRWAGAGEQGDCSRTREWQ